MPVPVLIVVNSPYRKFAPFLRRRDEQKAQTYVKWIYHQLGTLAVLAVSKSPVRTSLKLLIAVIVGIAALAAIAYADALRAQTRAETLLRDLRRFSVEKDFNQAFSLFRQRHASSLKRVEWCAAADCPLEIRVSNRPALFRYWTPYTELSALFEGRSGSVETILINYTTHHLRGVSPVVHVQLDSCLQPCERSFDINPHGESNELWNGLVALNATATGRERLAALSLNLDCFAQIRGCHDITEMLPSIWKQTAASTLVSRLPSLSDASWDKPQE